MKLRITNNSIRIRIRKSELKQLGKETIVSDYVNFGDNVVFSFALRLDGSLDKVKGTFTGSELEVAIPESIAKDWMEGDKVGIETYSDVSPNEKLHILIEKDFPCLDRENEDKSDTFWELVPKTEKSC